MSDFRLTAEGDFPNNVQYQWLRDGQPISGQTDATYQLTRADAGHNISVKASYKDNAGHDENPLSEATATVTDTPAPNPPPSPTTESKPESRRENHPQR